MKKLSLGLCILIFLLVLSIRGEPHTAPPPQQVKPPVTQPIKYGLVAYFMDYLSRSPAFNLTFTIQTNAVSFSGLTNVSGIYQHSWTSNVNVTDTLAITGMTVKNNFTVLSICDLFLENVRYSSIYDADGTRYWGFLTLIRPRITKEGNVTLFHCLIWVDKGKLVSLADRDPLTRSKMTLSLSPAVPASTIFRSKEVNEIYYLFPLNYSVTIRTATASPYPPITVRVDENTTFVSWTGLAAQAYSENLLNQLKERIDYFTAFGLSLVDETRQHVQVSSVFQHALIFFENRSYNAAFSTMQIGIRRAYSLGNALSQLASACTAMPILIILFSYGFASLLPAIMTEREKTRTALKLFMFFLTLFVFLLTQPHTQMGAALLLASLLGTTISHIDLMSIILSCTIFGTFSFVILLLISLKARVFIGFVLDMGIRDLRRRWMRTLLTLITIIVVIGASVTFTEVASGWTIVETERREGTEQEGLIISSAPLAWKFIQPDEVLWVQKQPWTESLGREKNALSYTAEGDTIGWFELSDPLDISVETATSIAAIDPDFMSKYYNLHSHIQGLGYLKEKEAAIFVPTTFTRTQVGDVVTLKIQIIPTDVTMMPPPVPLGKYLVKGKFNPTDLSQIKRIDGEPLFPSPENLVIMPFDSFPDSVGNKDIAKISSLTVIVKEGTNLTDLAKNTVFSLGYKVTVNADNVAISFQELYILSVVGWQSVVMPSIITALIVYLTMSSAIFERKGQITVFTTLGANPRVILQIFLIETLIIGFLSTFLGYFGSYLSALSLSKFFTFLVQFGVPVPKILETPLHWSLSGISIAFIMGMLISLLGGYLPCVRAQNVSLTGRPKKRDVLGDMQVFGDMCEYSLPVRVPSLDGEMLYVYFGERLKQNIPGHRGRGELFQDGTFAFKFDTMVENDNIVSCELKGVKKAEVIYPSMTFPARFKLSEGLQKLVYNLEKAALGYTFWREMRTRFEIIRMAPKLEVRKLDDILFDVRQMREQLRVVDEKLEKLEKLKLTISGAIYSEFEKRYLEERQKLNRRLRPLGLELEPFYNEMVQQMRELSVQMERLTTAHELGELDEKRYEEEVKPLKETLSDLQKRLDEIDYVFNQLRMPRPGLPKAEAARERERRRRVKTAEEAALPSFPCPYCGSAFKEISSDGIVICSKCRKKLQ